MRAPNPSAFCCGEIEDGYEVIAPMGGGTYTELYRARRVVDDREVVLKLLAAPAEPELAELLEQRFEVEGRIAASVDSPHVIKTLGCGTFSASQRHYICLEMLEGHDLQDELESGPLAPARALELCLQALDGLASLHASGLVHRDLKPLNLFVANPNTSDERLVVLDLGVAHDACHQARLTHPGMLAGTPQYLPPEYITTQRVTPGFDVYQMGLVLVELLTGAPVVDHDSVYLSLSLHTLGNLSIPGWIRDSALGPVLAKALHRDTSVRFADAGEMADAVVAVMEDALATLTAGPEGWATSRVRPDLPQVTFEYVAPNAEQGRTCGAYGGSASEHPFGPGRYVGSCYHDRADIAPRSCATHRVRGSLEPVSRVPANPVTKMARLRWAGVAVAMLLALAVWPSAPSNQLEARPASPRPMLDLPTTAVHDPEPNHSSVPVIGAAATTTDANAIAAREVLALAGSWQRLSLAGAKSVALQHQSQHHPDQR